MTLGKQRDLGNVGRGKKMRIYSVGIANGPAQSVIAASAADAVRAVRAVSPLAVTTWVHRENMSREELEGWN